MPWTRGTRLGTLAGAGALALATVLAVGTTAEARGGCGPGFHPNIYGVCRPNFGPRLGFYGPRRFYGPRFYGPRPYFRRGWRRF